MAAASLLTLIDDIAAALDDMALMTKVAAKKTAGVIGDDLALNANQVSGVDATRELPIVWGILKGSFVNKLIIVPAALLLSAFAPALIVPLMVVGGLFLCYEGAHKVLEKITGHDDHSAHVQAALDPKVDLKTFERDKIKGAVRTDFILSAEIIVISLGAVTGQPLTVQIGVLTAIALAATFGIYGMVALIVKADDAGMHLVRKESGVARGVGRGLLWGAPRFMKLLAVLGTIAMFSVGGDILLHATPFVHHFVEGWPWWGTLLAAIAYGFVAGLVVAGIVSLVGRMRGTGSAAAH